MGPTQYVVTNTFHEEWAISATTRNPRFYFGHSIHCVGSRLKTGKSPNSSDDFQSESFRKRGNQRQIKLRKFGDKRTTRPRMLTGNVSILNPSWKRLCVVRSIQIECNILEMDISSRTLSILDKKRLADNFNMIVRSILVSIQISLAFVMQYAQILIKMQCALRRSRSNVVK